jgi:hypothetical protein
VAEGKNKLTKPNVEIARLEHTRKLRIIDGSVSIINTLIKFGCLAAVFLFSYWMVDSLAGKQTFANIGVSVLFDSRTLAIIFGGGGVVYGLAERRLRKKTVKRFQPRIKELEQLLDPNRTSSLLTEGGDTNPEDE